MPYASNDDLNADVRKAHPTAHGQNAFRHAFNSAHAMYGDEATAFKVAHHAADQAERHHGGKVHVHVHLHHAPVAPSMDVQPLSSPMTKHLGTH